VKNKKKKGLAFGDELDSQALGINDENEYGLNDDMENLNMRDNA
jgi:hypothetical protein